MGVDVLRQRLIQHGQWDLVRREAVAVIRLATPVVLVQLGMMAMGTVDTMMLGRVSAEALAGGSLGNSITLGLMVFPFGVLMALDPLISQSYGAGDHKGICRYFGAGLLLALAITLPMSFIMWNARPLLVFLGQEGAVLEGASSYARALVPGNAAFLLFIVLRQTLQAMSVVRPAVYAIVVGNLVNFVANYALIFGHFGFPSLGVEGSAYSSALARWIMVLCLVLTSQSVLRQYWRGLSRAAFALHAHRLHLRIGIPIGVHVSFEVWIYMAIVLIMGHFGTQELAGHQIAINLASLSFMVPLGIGAAASTRVGNSIGREEMPAARRAAVVCLTLGGLVMVLFALVLWSVAQSLSLLFTTDPRAVAMAVVFIPIAALFQVFDGIQAVAAGILRGAADTRVSAVVSFIGFWLVGLPLGVLLAFPLGQGPVGLWWGLTLGLSTVAILLVARIRSRFASTVESLRVRGESAAGGSG